MQNKWAEENLYVIRTLMERSAIYRRALAPVMLMAGSIGAIAALMGWKLELDAKLFFVAYWLGVGLVVMCAAYFLMRRQALQAGESFWSAPTKRITQAILPAFVAGLILGVIMMETSLGNLIPALTWVLAYGCGIHAAGFFMPRGMRLFGWIFILGGGAFPACVCACRYQLPPYSPHFVMGFFFGGLHLAYGVYLFFTEKKSPVPR